MIIKLNYSKLYYLTQYANYMTDAGYYATLEESLTNNFINESIDQTEADQILDVLNEISSELMPYINDAINEKVFNKLYYIKNYDDVVRIKDFLAAIKNNDIDALEEITNDIYNYMYENNILTPETWEELADDDLRNNGIDARCLYWVKKITYKAEFLELNAYENDFNELDAEDIIFDYLKNYFDYNDLI